MRGAILDIDGTLVDSNDAHARSWVDAFRIHGHDVRFDEVRPLIGMGGDRLLYALASIDDESSEGKALAATRKEIFLRDHLPGIKAFPRVRELLTRLVEKGFDLAVASASEEDVLDKLIALTGASELLSKRVKKSQAPSSKPAPDSVQAALDLLGISPRETVMLGDTPYDRDASRSAGVAFVGFRCGGWSESDLAGAAAIYDDPADLLENFDRSPLGALSRR
jgi:phosphoglycolate phosphatase-like HAD superfamily hydrolase